MIIVRVLSASQTKSRLVLIGMTIGSLLIPGVIRAQTPPADTNFNSWFMYFGDHAIPNTRWGIHLEGQARRSEGINTWQQWLLRSGVNFRLTDHIVLAGGLAYVKSYPYGSVAGANVRENRFYEQLAIRNRFPRLSVQNRFRLEQRLIENAPGPHGEDRGWDYRNRVRYMVRSDVPFGKTGRRSKFGLGVYNEVFINFGAERGPRAFAQDRAYGALTYKISKTNRIEMGYLFQYIPFRTSQISDYNHTLQLAWYSTTPFGSTK